MKMKKYELESFINYIHPLKLDRPDTRMKARFEKILINKYNDFVDEMNEINNVYAVKDNDGKPIIENNKMTFENNEERLKEIRELSTEDVYIEQNEENKKMLLSIKESVLYRGPSEFAGDEALIYDSLAEIVEQITYKE
ncbi:hypothetical protein [Paenibacillus sp. FSL E2-0178]|uniref:hypothetical protein n=1 Tax=Paenibacillus sp. FSL E2-0178 TaxID=2921361 RepID=UPI003158126D